MRESKGLMGLPAPSLGFDGLVQIGMSQVEVKDGDLTVQGRRLYVDEEGIVYDERDREVARVQNGRLVPLRGQNNGNG